MSDMAFVLHLSLEVSSAERADEIARQFLRLMSGGFPEMDVAFSSISPEDDQNHRRYLFCSKRLDDNQRCMQRSGHQGEHSPTWSC